jgi:hypothetical protein
MRGRLVRRIGGGIVVCLAAAAAFAGGAPSTTAATAAVLTGSYAGLADGAPVAVSVVADAPATEGAQRTISMYVANGTSLAAWLTGQAPGNSAVLRSADRRFNARVTLTPLSARGVLAIPGGKPLAFSVLRTANLSGLFDVTVTRAGLIQGKSTTGATLTGQVGGAGSLARAKSVAAIARSGASTLKLTASARNLTPGSYRWIVLSNGKVYAANKRGAAFGGIGGLTARLPGTNTPGGTARAARVSAGSAGQPGWDDAACQKLADAWQATVDLQADAILAGDTQTADEAGVVAAAAMDKLSDHCVVIGIP